MYTHLREQKSYEDSYDRLTVECARKDIVYYDNFFDELKSKLPKDDKIDRPGNALILNLFYMQVIGDDLIRRYKDRDNDIRESMAKDEAKDDQIATARLNEEPSCQHCSEQGLKITDKSLMHRGDDYKYDDPEEVLFMLSCPHCKKNSAFWEDGTEWKSKPTLCPKCSAEMTHKVTEAKTSATFTYKCSSCKHSYKEKMDFTSKKKKGKPDSDYYKDRAMYCLLDKKFRENLFAVKDGIERWAEFGKELKEKEDNKHIYDAVDDLRKLKIPELTTILSPAIEKAGYVEFSLDKPEVGREVTVGFSCLDNKTDREDYDSRKILKKTIDKAMEETNWRLMSDGIHYRLGYLSGRLRAYEGEEDLKKLVMKNKKLKAKRKSSKSKTEDKKNEYRIKDKDGRDIIL